MKLLVFITMLALSVTCFVAAATWHDNMIMRRNNESMRKVVAEMQSDIEKQASEMRQLKTDAEIALRIVTTGDYVK